MLCLDDALPYSPGSKDANVLHDPITGFMADGRWLVGMTDTNWDAPIQASVPTWHMAENVYLNACGADNESPGSL